MATSDESPLTGKRSTYLVIAVLLIGVVGDQASKSWATLRAEEPRVLVPGYVVACAIPNTGMILGVGGDQAMTGRVFGLLGVACAALVVRVALKGRWKGADWLAGAVLLAGILGNTADRLALGHVRDFLVTRATPTIAFNVADLLVVIGGAMLLVARFFGMRRTRSNFGLAGLVSA